MKIIEPIAMFVFACAGPAASALAVSYFTWWLGALTLIVWSGLLALWIRRFAVTPQNDRSRQDLP